MPLRLATSRWQRFTAAVALATAALLLAVGLAFGDRESLVLGAIALGVAVALALTRGWLALVVLLGAGALFVDVAAWMVPAAFTNLSRREPVVDVGTPAVLAAVALLGLVGVVLALVRRGDAPGWGAGPLLAAGTTFVVLAAVLVIAGVRGAGVERGPRPGDLVLRTGDMEFSTDRLEADAGRIAVHVANRDLFWHTFTVKKLDVDVWVSARAERRAVFRAEPGTYRFVCDVPGHESVGMEGVLVVR